MPSFGGRCFAVSPEGTLNVNTRKTVQPRASDKLLRVKAKIVYATSDLNMAFQLRQGDATAFNALKKGTIVGKAGEQPHVGHALFRAGEGGRADALHSARPSPTASCCAAGSTSSRSRRSCADVVAGSLASVPDSRRARRSGSPSSSSTEILSAVRSLINEDHVRCSISRRRR